MAKSGNEAEQVDGNGGAGDPSRLERVLKHWPVIASIGTACVYVAGRLAFQRYYGEFGLAPEEVGLTEAGVLVRLVPIALCFLVPTAVCVGILLLWKDTKTRCIVGFVALFVTFVVLVVGLVEAIRVADERADAVREGKAVVDDWLWRFESKCVSANWAGAAPSDAPFEDGDPVVYLGRSDGVAVFVIGETTYRVAASSVALSSRPHAECERFIARS
jgi:hypothetical protein